MNGNYELGPSVLKVQLVSGITDIKIPTITQKYVKKVDIKIQKGQVQASGIGLMKKMSPKKGRLLSSKRKLLVERSYSSGQQTEHISPSKSSNSLNSYGQHGGDELIVYDQGKSNIIPNSKVNTSA
jgi:hypothetical protein